MDNSIRKADAGNYETINVKHFGALADGKNDDSSAIHKAVDRLFRQGGGVLYFPCGIYRIAQRISASLDGCAISIVGDGLGVSNLYSDNADGIFQFSRDKQAAPTTVRDLSFFAVRPGAGTAIELSHTVEDSAHRRSLVIQHVEIRGMNIDTDYFTRGIKAVGQQLPLFLNVIVAGPFGPKVSDERSADSLLYKAECGIWMDRTRGASFQHCYVWSARTAYRVESKEGEGGEDIAFYRSFAVGCRTGMDISSATEAKRVVVDTCHVNCLDAGIVLRKRRTFTITNCLLYNSLKENKGGETAPNPPYTDIQLTDCSGGLIADNIFHQPTNKNRTMVEMHGQTSDISVKDNYFNAEGTAVAVRQDVRNVVCANNSFTNEVTKVVDDPAAEAVFTSFEFHGALLNLTHQQPIPDGGWTDVVWSAAVYDTHPLWDGQSRFVIPDSQGIRFVKLSANVVWGDDSHGQRQVEFVKNGTSAFAGNGRSALEAERPGEQNVKSAVIPVKTGDKLGLRVRQLSGDTLHLEPDVSTWFSIQIVNG